MAAKISQKDGNKLSFNSKQSIRRRSLNTYDSDESIESDDIQMPVINFLGSGKEKKSLKPKWYSEKVPTKKKDYSKKFNSRMNLPNDSYKKMLMKSLRDFLTLRY